MKENFSWNLFLFHYTGAEDRSVEALVALQSNEIRIRKDRGGLVDGGKVPQVTPVLHILRVLSAHEARGETGHTKHEAPISESEGI